MSEKSDIKLRVYLIFLGVVLWGILIVVKAGRIQANDKELLLSKLERKHIKEEELIGDRGKIYGDDNVLLASTIPVFDIYIDFSTIDKDTFYTYLQELSEGVARVLGGTGNEYARKFRMLKEQKKGNRYWPLKKKISYAELKELQKLPIFRKGKYQGGFIVESSTSRIKPYGALASRTIGIHRKEGGSVGLELMYDDVLRGNKGVRRMRRVSGGAWEPMKEGTVEPEMGKDIVTSINVDIQGIVHDALHEVIVKYNSQFGTAIVMEVETGEIKALANLGLQENGSYAEDFNYALMPSEPGSTFKLMSLLALIDDGYVNIDDKVDVEGGYKRFGRQRIVDDSRGLGVISVKEAFAKSSNVAFAKMVDEYYKDNPMKFINKLRKLHLHIPTGIDLKGEPNPLIKDTKSPYWNKVTSLPWIAYGYESLITPLHTCMVYNAVANGGKLMKPYIVKEIREYGQTIQKIEPTVLESKIAKPSTIKQLQEALHAVVEEGTGRGLKSPYYHAGGKTGTAQVAGLGISYRDGIRQGSFVGYFPIDNPKYTIAVLVRSQPHGIYYGAVLGGAVFKEIADKLYASKIGGWELPINDSTDYFRIPSTVAFQNDMSILTQYMNWQPIKADDSNILNIYSAQNNKGKIISSQNKKIDFKNMPDLQGMSLKDALFLLENAGLKVKIQGKGKVNNQSIKAGSSFKKGDLVHLELI